jgi:hypothetical protein
LGIIAAKYPAVYPRAGFSAAAECSGFAPKPAFSGVSPLPKKNRGLVVAWKEWFTSSGRDKSRLAKNIKTTTSEFANTADRYAAMQDMVALAKKDPDASQEIFVGLLRRFSMTASKSIEDEEEKSWLYQQLVSFGKPILPAVQEYCVGHDNIAWALRLLEEIANEEQEWACIHALLAAHRPDSFDRTPAKKQQILTHLHEIESPKVAPILCEYLNDRDETVRFHTVECLFDIADEATLPALIERLTSPQEDALRVRTRILDGLAKTGWSIASYKSRLVPVLGTEHVFDANTIKRR